jgi:hypothetical protein
LFTSNIDRTTRLAKSNCFIEENKVDEIYIASHRYPKSGLDANRYYIFEGYENEGYEKLKVMLCRRFLRIIDAIRVVPAFIAIIPLRLCETEIIEGLLAFDPDVIGTLILRWGPQLQKLLRKNYPQWTGIAGSKKKPWAVKFFLDAQYLRNKSAIGNGSQPQQQHAGAIG